MFTHTLQRAGAVALAFVSLSASAGADDLTLDPVAISASRVEADTGALPLGTIIIDRAMLDTMPGRFLSEALDGVAGVQVRSLGDIGDRGTSVDLLGFGASGPMNTLILLNGRRLNAVDLAATDLSAIPLSAIERIEILPAGGAALYGNGAVGGTINIVTRERHRTGLEARLEAGEFATRGAALGGGVAGAHQSGFAFLRHLETDGYRQNNALEQWNLFADWRGGRNGAFSLTTLIDRQETGLAGPRRVEPGNDQLASDPDGTDTPNDWAEQRGVHLMPGVRVALADDLALQVDASLRWREQRSFLEGTWGFSAWTGADTRTLSLSPRLIGSGSAGGRAHHWALGADVHDTRFERDAALDENTRRTPIHQVDIDQQIAALWWHSQLVLTPAATLTLGARHEWVETRGRDRFDPTAPAPPCFSLQCDGPADPLDLDQDTGMYSIGLRYAIGEFAAAFVNLDRSARYATVDEMFESHYDFVTDVTTHVLEPLHIQRGTTASTGLSWHRAGQFSTLTLWRGDYDDEIHFDAMTFDNINLDPTRRYGVSLNSSWQLERNLRLGFAASWQRARFRAGPHDGNEVPLVPRQTAHIRLDWQALDWLGVSVTHRYLGKRHFDNDQSNDFGARMPSWRRTDLALRATRARLFAELGVYNIENRVVYDYAVRSNYAAGTFNAYPLPERHVMASIGVRM